MDRFEWLLVISCVLILLGSIALAVIKTKVEQDTFNQCRSANVSFIQAAFTNLRVEDC